MPMADLTRISTDKLAEILAATEKATGPDREIDAMLARMGGWTFTKMNGDARPYWRKPGVTQFWDRQELPGFTASIDAALALVERLLPGRGIVMGLGRETDREPMAAAAIFNGLSADSGDASEAEAPTLPIAILTALLRALIAKDTNNG